MRNLKNLLKAPPKNDQHGFQSIYYFSRCVGLWPFTITYNSNGSIKEARICLFDWLWFWISNCLNLAALFCSYERQSYEQSSYEDYFWYLIYNSSEMPTLLYLTASITLDMFNRNKLVNILKKFIIFDRKVGLIYFKK